MCPAFDTLALYLQVGTNRNVRHLLQAAAARQKEATSAGAGSLSAGAMQCSSPSSQSTVRHPTLHISDL